MNHLLSKPAYLVGQQGLIEIMSSLYESTALFK